MAAGSTRQYDPPTLTGPQAQRLHEVLTSLSEAAVAGTGYVVVDAGGRAGALAAPMLAQARHRHGDAGHLLRADARRLPLADRSVDTVFAAGLVQHLPDPAAGVRELGRVTRSGGRLVIFHPSGRAALAVRHGRTLRPEEPLAEDPLRQLLAGRFPPQPVRRPAAPVLRARRPRLKPPPQM